MQSGGLAAPRGEFKAKHRDRDPKAEQSREGRKARLSVCEAPPNQGLKQGITEPGPRVSHPQVAIEGLRGGRTLVPGQLLHAPVVSGQRPDSATSEGAAQNPLELVATEGEGAAHPPILGPIEIPRAVCLRTLFLGFESERLQRLLNQGLEVRRFVPSLFITMNGPLRQAIRVDLPKLLRSKSRALAVLGLAYFLLALPSADDIPPLRSLPPFELWLWVSGILVLLAISYFASIALCVWVGREMGQEAPEYKGLSLFKATYELMLPLTILGLRGTLLFVCGLFLLVVPGFYFALKYQLASLALALEGWVGESPVKQAEALLRRERFKILGFAGWMLLDPMLSLASEWVAQGLGWEKGIVLRTISAIALGFMALVIDLVMAAAFVRMIRARK